MGIGGISLWSVLLILAIVLPFMVFIAVLRKAGFFRVVSRGGFRPRRQPDHVLGIRVRGPARGKAR